MKPHRILLIAEGQLGDLILLTPALRALKTSLPHAHVTVLILQRRHYTGIGERPSEVLVRGPRSGTAEVLATNPHVDEIIEINRYSLRGRKGFARLRAEMEIVRFLRSKKYDTVICTFPEDRFVLWSLGAGAKQRVGQKQQRMGWMLNVRPDIHKEIGGVLNYYCDLAEAAGGKVDSSETEYRVPDSGREWADRFLTTHNLKGKPRLVVLHPGASAPHRMWPPDRCAAVIEILRSDGRTAVVLCGSEADSTVVGEVKRHLRTEIPVAEPGGSIPNFAGLLQACMLCICNDSGPRHLAAAVGTASLAFAPRFNAPAWKIYADDLRSGTMEGRDECPACPPGECRNILPKGAEFGSICLRMIGVEEAAARARAVLEALSASPRGRTQ